MRPVLMLVLLTTGCGIDVLDCIDFGGGCGPPPLELAAPSFADAETSAGLASGGAYQLSLEGGEGSVEVQGARHVAVESIAGTTIHLRGRSPGQDQLAIVRGESRATHWVRVVALQRASLVPRETAFVRLAAPPPFALLAGGEAELVIRLSSSEGDRLIDTALAIELDGQTVTPARWDALAVRPGAPFVVDVQAAGRAFAFTVPVVTAIQDLVPVAGGDVADITALPAGRLSLVCFAAITAGLHVAGLDFAIEGEGASVPSHGSLAPGGCVHVAAPRDGQTLRVRAGGLERTFTLRTR